jgi:5-methylcytosine-specific restriction endonuclease McrA
MTTRSLHLAKDLTLPLDAVTQTKAEALAKQRARARRWRAANRERLRSYFESYRRDHPELSAYHADYYRQNKVKWEARPAEARRGYRRRCYPKTKDRLNAARRAERAKHPDIVHARDRRRRSKRRDQKRLADRLYRQQSPEKAAASVAKARAKKPELYRQMNVNKSARRWARLHVAVVEAVSLERLLTRDGARCHLCRLPVDRGDRSFDHLIPVVRQGAHAEWNLMVAHRWCNQRRGTKQILPDETRAAAEAYVIARTSGDGETVA